MEDIRLIRETRSVCSICCTEIPARIIRKNGRIIMEKNCPQHGDLSFILSSNANCFEELSEAHFTILPTGMPLKILELSMTSRCEMNCPICSVMRSIGSRSHDLTTEDVKRIISEHPDKEITLWGMEPIMFQSF